MGFANIKRDQIYSLRVRNVRFILNGNVTLLFVTFVHVDAVSEGDGFSCGYRQIAGAFGFLFEIMHAEWIGGEKPVISHVPPGWVMRIVRVIEYRYAHDLAIDQP